MDSSDRPSHDFRLAGFRLRVFGREFPDLLDGWDASWLLARAECSAKGSAVWAEGPFVRLDEIEQLSRAMESLASWKKREAKIRFMEPTLALGFEAGARGDLSFRVELTPDHLEQFHKFEFDIDLSYLAAAIEQCRAILAAYPVRGNA